MAAPTFQDEIEAAHAHRLAGRLQQAEQLYRQVLERRPDNFAALHSLGVIAHQTGRYGVAMALIGRAIALAPNNVEAHNSLGNALKASGQLDEAIAAFRRAVALNPASSGARANLGASLQRRGQLDEAIASYRQAIALKPDFHQAWYNLGAALQAKDQFDEAVAAYRRAISIQPNFALACHNLGNLLSDRRRRDEAVAAYRQAVAFQPDFPEAHHHLGLVLMEKGNRDEAIAAFRRSIELRPESAATHLNLGIVLGDAGRLEEALAAIRRAIALDGSLPEAHHSLGNILKELNRLDEAVAAHRQAIVLRPGYADAHCGLGIALAETGRGDDAIAAYRQAILLRPAHAEANGNLLYMLHFHPAYDAGAIAQEHRRWNEVHARPLRNPSQRHENDRDPDRRLKIGYVSADFRDHVVGGNMLPLFRQHDRGRFEIFAYSNVRRPHPLTARFRSHCDGWRDIVNLHDQQVAEVVMEDRIDILVDLALHMDGGRLLVFARKPAPVQVTFAGYPGSTGLDAIDYRLTDPYLDPVDSGSGNYSEEPIRLPDSFWCYDPAVMTSGTQLQPQAAPLPALASGTVTFGCLNNFRKVNQPVLALWARVLKAVNGSRLMLLAPEGSARERTLDILSRQGIDAARVEFVPKLPTTDYLAQYDRIDIGLDTFPYNGHTTSLDSLWMGVPVVTLVGKTVVGRAGLSQLTNLNLTELAAATEEQFVRIAADLAGNLFRLNELRSSLRRRMRGSPLTDATRFARGIEAAYRRMWRTWCESAVLGDFRECPFGHMPV